MNTRNFLMLTCQLQFLELFEKFQKQILLDFIAMLNTFKCNEFDVLFQQRVRVFDHGIKTRENNELQHFRDSLLSVF